MEERHGGRRLHHTYILDIIRSYSLVVAIYGTLGYNNNVQPFLIGSVLEEYKEADAFKNMTENLLHSQKLDPMMEDNLELGWVGCLSPADTHHTSCSSTRGVCLFG